jgi:hypothetical protein
MARVNVDFETWLAFRTHALHQQRSVACYIGDLVAREVRRVNALQREPSDVAAERHRSL